MPTRKRPNPEFPPEGFIGKQAQGSEGAATEWSITIPHPTKPGMWTNVPSLTPNQIGTSTLPGPVMTAEQFRRAHEFAKYLATSGYDLPAFKTPDEAAFQAGHRHKAMDRPDPTMDYQAVLNALRKPRKKP